QHPEIHDEVIDRPVIVAGLPRSGTTHLLNLMAADRRFRALPYWESREPVPTADEPPSVPGEDPRYTRCRLGWEQTDELMPLLKAMHAMTPDHIHEELELMCPDFASYNYEWLFTAPSWRDHYLAADQTPHYRYMRTVLGLLQWQDRMRGEPPRRWVLKCPQHLEQLPVLMDTFPDATVAITHRDPTSVIASAATMMSYGDRMRRIHPDPPAAAAYWADRAETLLTRCTRDRDVVPAGQSIDVRFDEFMADDIAMVERIYQVAGIEMTAEARADLDEYMVANPRGAHGRIVYDLTPDFGLDRSELRRGFTGYMGRFDVQPEGDDQ
ncbi:MAG: sulfotransferase family protein, partial [Acidimicrobiales bacterium]